MYGTVDVKRLIVDETAVALTGGSFQPDQNRAPENKAIALQISYHRSGSPIWPSLLRPATSELTLPRN